MRTAKQTARIFGLSAVQVKTCANCGKQFPIVSPDYAYKIERRQGRQILFVVLQLCVYADDSKAAGGKTKKSNSRQRSRRISLSASKKARSTQPEDACRVSRQEGGQGAPERRRRPEAGSLHPAEKGNFETKLTAKERETIEGMVNRMREADEERKKKRKGSKKQCQKENS